MTAVIVAAAWITLAISAPFIADRNDKSVDEHVRRGFDWTDAA